MSGLYNLLQTHPDISRQIIDFMRNDTSKDIEISWMNNGRQVSSTLLNILRNPSLRNKLINGLSSIDNTASSIVSNYEEYAITKK
jgi:hypothetical protein